MTTIRAIPQAAEAEEALIGCLLLDPDALLSMLGTVTPADFWDQKCQWCYEAAVAVSERQEPVNHITLAYQLALDDRLEAVGGQSYLSYLANGVPVGIFAAPYAEMVRAASFRRTLLSTSSQIAALAQDGGGDTDALLSQAEALLFNLQRGRKVPDFMLLRDALDSYLAGGYREDGTVAKPIATGFRNLDTILIGLHRSDLVILAARPGMGKTAFALNLAHHAAVAGERVALFSLEMDARQIVGRLLSTETGIPMQRLDLSRQKGGLLSDDEERRLIDAVGALSELPVYLDDSASLGFADLRAKALRLHARQPLGLVVVDYLQLMQGAGRENRVQQVADLSRSLKALARELHVSVLALSQLSRAVEQRQPHIPMLSDLRESGALEQDADVVLFIYREDVYMTQEEWERRHPSRAYPEGVANLIVAKHRNGPTGQADLYFQKKTATFYPLVTWSEG